jgi:hypothetical protein
MFRFYDTAGGQQRSMPQSCLLRGQVPPQAFRLLAPWLMLRRELVRDFLKHGHVGDIAQSRLHSPDCRQGPPGSCANTHRPAQLHHVADVLELKSELVQLPVSGLASEQGDYPFFGPGEPAGRPGGGAPG